MDTAAQTLFTVVEFRARELDDTHQNQTWWINLRCSVKPGGDVYDVHHDSYLPGKNKLKID